MRPDSSGFKEALDHIKVWEKAADRNIAIDIDM